MLPGFSHACSGLLCMLNEYFLALPLFGRMATRRTASASIIAYVRASLKRSLARTGGPTKLAHMQPFALGHVGMLKIYKHPYAVVLAALAEQHQVSTYCCLHKPLSGHDLLPAQL